MNDTDDRFFEPYNREEIAYGDVPSAPLAAYLSQVPCHGSAIDLGAGGGRDTLALARAGFDVKAVDLSQRGLDRIAARAKEFGVNERLTTECADVRSVELPPSAFQAVVATTVLDHVPAAEAEELWNRLAASVAEGGVLYAEVHTVEDPGSGHLPGNLSDAPVSETADAVVNYFSPNQLLAWAIRSESCLRVLRYEERLEWDYTHGEEHLHGKAILLAVRSGAFPEWYGQPPAFPKR